MSPKKIYRKYEWVKFVKGLIVSILINTSMDKNIE